MPADASRFRAGLRVAMSTKSGLPLQRQLKFELQQVLLGYPGLMARRSLAKSLATSTTLVSRPRFNKALCKESKQSKQGNQSKQNKRSNQREQAEQAEQEEEAEQAE